MQVSKSGRVYGEKFKFMYGGIELEYVDKFTYLGMTISSNCNFLASVDNLGDKAMKALFHLKKYIGTSNILPECGIKLYEQLHVIVPISLYGCEIWGIIKCPNKEQKLTLEDKYRKMKFEKFMYIFANLYFRSTKKQLMQQYMGN